MKSKLIFFLVILTTLTACTEPVIMIDVKEILADHTCGSSSPAIDSENKSSISEFDDIPYLTLLQSLGPPSSSTDIEFSGLKETEALLPEFYLGLMSRLRDVPVEETLSIKEKSWTFKDDCVLTVWYEGTGETLQPIANLFYDRNTDF